MLPPIAVCPTWMPWAAELVVEHPGVCDLAGERDPDSRTQRIGVDRRAAGGEEDGARAAFEHRVDRATRPTGIPSRPKRRATAEPRFGPAPTMTMDISQFLRF
jgi:hypothetical protein